MNPLRYIWRYVRENFSRHPYPFLGISALLMALLFEFAPYKYLTLTNTGFLVGAITFSLCCFDFNVLLVQWYRKRDDLKEIRWLLIMMGAFIFLLALGRVLGFVSLFYDAARPATALAQLASGAVAVLLVLLTRAGQQFMLNLPRLSELREATNIASDTKKMLAFREEHALEAMMTSRDMTVIWANEWAHTLFGYDFKKLEMIGLRSDQLVHSDDHHIAYQAVLNDVKTPYFMRIVRKDGAIRFIQTIGEWIDLNSNSDESGKPDRLRLTNFRDVTMERRYLSEIAPSNSNDYLVHEMNQLRSYFDLPANP